MEAAWGPKLRSRKRSKLGRSWREGRDKRKRSHVGQNHVKRRAKAYARLQRNRRGVA